VKKAIKESGPNKSLRDVIEKNKSIKKHLSKKEIDALLIPANYVGSASEIVERSVKLVRVDLRK
jgi:adenylosuccinate lyase